MRGPAPHTAENATPQELWWGSVRLLAMLVAVCVIIILLYGLPLGETTRVGLLAWLLVVLALYWLYAGMGYQALLLVQLGLFSTAAVLLTLKVGLVIVGIERLSILRRFARALVFIGGGMAALNLGGMIVGLLKRRAQRVT